MFSHANAGTEWLPGYWVKDSEVASRFSMNEHHNEYTVLTFPFFRGWGEEQETAPAHSLYANFYFCACKSPSQILFTGDPNTPQQPCGFWLGQLGGQQCLSQK